MDIQNGDRNVRLCVSVQHEAHHCNRSLVAALMLSVLLQTVTEVISKPLLNLLLAQLAPLSTVTNCTATALLATCGALGF